MKNLDHYTLLAELFRYPNQDIKTTVNEIQVFLDKNYPDAGDEFNRFSEFIANSTFYQIEEIFQKTFHIQAICFLDLGYVIFAEDYKRGEFLVNMKVEQEKYNNDYEHELADNLPYVLRLLPLHKDENFINELVVMVMIPALEKMLSEFDASKVKIREKVMNKKQKVVIMEGIKDGNIYKNVISAILQVFKIDFADIKFEIEAEIIPAYAKVFLHSDCSDGCTTSIPTPEEIKRRSREILN
jgi:nitrate reductase assembly molybdenum cofactor insertion protein NarJ